MSTYENDRNYDLVNKAFDLLLEPLQGLIGQQMRLTYKNDWWEEIRNAVGEFSFDLPAFGDYAELVGSLDIMNCLRVIDFRWGFVFKNYFGREVLSYVRELKGARNAVAHRGSADMDQHVAERAVDTMALIVKQIDTEAEAEIREIYRELRSRAGDARETVVVEYNGPEQPESESVRGALAHNSLLQLDGTEFVQKTNMTRKVTSDGVTKIYPVYRVRLDKLYYNDRNDRIATWISRYETENGKGSLEGLPKDLMNELIEGFITESNEDAIRKTQTNIRLVGQRESGVTLADGRVVDGNRRFTCLRRIQKETGEPQYFETAIMDLDIAADLKRIKRLELEIQHGEEKKVDYDWVDFAIGTYRDIVETGLFTVEEYAASTNESPAQVKKRLANAEMIHEFLQYIRLPGQYYAARDYAVYSLFDEMTAPLNKLGEEDKERLKKIAFNNALMNGVPDQRKFIRDIKKLVANGVFEEYFEDQMALDTEIRGLYEKESIHTKADADRFAEAHPEIAGKMQESLERAIDHSRSVVLKNKPGETVAECINKLLDIDSRMFRKMDEEERASLKAQLDELMNIAGTFGRQL